MNPRFNQVLSSSAEDRRDLFVTSARRLGTNERNLEKDFWVCWTLDALFHELPDGGLRLLFKGGTSLSKAFGLISRFSEDIDITVFRHDLGQGATVEELEAMSGKQRRAKLEQIRDSCRAYISGALRVRRHRFDDKERITSTPVLGGLHHEYALERALA